MEWFPKNIPKNVVAVKYLEWENPFAIASAGCAKYIFRERKENGDPMLPGLLYTGCDVFRTLFHVNVFYHPEVFLKFSPDCLEATLACIIKVLLDLTSFPDDDYFAFFQYVREPTLFEPDVVQVLHVSVLSFLTLAA